MNGWFRQPGDPGRRRLKCDMGGALGPYARPVPDVIDYDADSRRRDEHRRLMKLFWGLIIAKTVMVLLNTFGAFSDVPNLVKYVGVGVQITLTVCFLLLLLKLSARR